MKNPNAIKLISLLSAGRRQICANFKKMKSLEPMTFLQIETLRFIIEQKKPKMIEVAKFLGITPPSTTSLIDTLVKKKMLERKKISQDRRSVRLVVTAKGKNFADRCFDELASHMEKLFSGLTLNEQRLLIKLHHKIFKINDK